MSMTTEEARRIVEDLAQEHHGRAAEALRLLLTSGTCATCQHWREAVNDEERDECDRLGLWTPPQPFGCTKHAPRAWAAEEK